MKPLSLLAAAVLTLGVATALAAPAAGAGAPADPTEGAQKLDLAKATALGGGKMLLIQGKARKNAPGKFSLEGLSVMQPVVVSLLTRPAKSGAQLSVLKPFVQAPPKTERTDTTGLARLSFRVQGDALIQVQPEGEPGEYQLMVWVGPELRPPMASPFTSVTADSLRNATEVKK